MLRADHWIWLVLTVVLHWSLPGCWRIPFLAGACVGYLGWVQPGVTGFFFLGTCLVHRVLRHLASNQAGTAGVTLTLGLSVLLAAWKVLPTAGIGLSFREVSEFGLAPIGLSYLIFKLIHVSVEVWRRAFAVPDLPEFVAYLFFVPMFTAGPIERLDHFRSGREAEWKREVWVEGGTRIIQGVIKKFAIGETVLYQLVKHYRLEDPSADLSTVTPQAVWWVALLGYLRIYLDFSGYSDIALGTARLLGFRLVENFNWPVLATNPSDFWRRWHISLSQWCQYYIYMPSMGVLRSPYVPLFLTFLVMGAWHVVSWNRVGWAAYNAAGVIVFMAWSRWMGRPRVGTWRASAVWRWTSVLFTQVFVLGSIVFFMNGEDQTLTRSLHIMARMFGIPIVGLRSP